MADMRSPLEQARWLHSAERWIEACDVFLAVDEVEPLSARDLELLATEESGWLLITTPTD